MAEVGLKAGEVGEDLVHLGVAKAEPFADEGGFLIDGGGGYPTTAVAGGVDAAIDGEIWEASVNAAAFDGATGDDAVAAPGVVGATGLVALVGGEGAIEIAGGEHHYLVPHADGFHGVGEGFDATGEVVDEAVLALVGRGRIGDLRGVGIPAADLDEEDLALVGEHAAACDEASDDFELIAEVGLAETAGEPVRPMLVHGGIGRGGLGEGIADEAFGVAGALRDADVGFVKEAVVGGGEDLLQGTQAIPSAAILVVGGAERIARREASDACERCVFVRWRAAAEVVRIEGGIAQRGAISGARRTAAEASERAHGPAGVHEVRLLGEADLKAVRSGDADAHAEVTAIHSGDDFGDAAAPALREGFIWQRGLPLHLLVGMREELRRLGGGGQGVEIGPRDGLCADEGADVGDKGEVLRIKERFERVSTGMEGKIALRVIGAIERLELPGIQRCDAGGDGAGVVIGGAVEVAVVGCWAVVELSIGDVEYAASGVVIRAGRSAASGDEEVVGIAAAVEEDADEGFVVFSGALRCRRADELELRDGIHERGEAHRGTTRAEEEVSAVGLGAVFGLFEEDVHDESGAGEVGGAGNDEGRI